MLKVCPCLIFPERKSVKRAVGAKLFTKWYVHVQKIVVFRPWAGEHFNACWRKVESPVKLESEESG